MDFKKAAKFGNYLSKNYAEDLFRLLMTYNNISASEAASRLNLHIRTVQEFFEAMYELEILRKEEVFEKKRPYFRYSLEKSEIRMELDLKKLFNSQQPQGQLSQKIREYPDARARFSLSRDGQHISHVYIWTGNGREQKERKISLSLPQGKFLFYLPFPSADALSVNDIMKKADVEEKHSAEILDIVQVLIEFKVIDKIG
jgi:predicted transcriptional regulator